MQGKYKEMMKMSKEERQAIREQSMAKDTKSQ